MRREISCTQKRLATPAFATSRSISQFTFRIIKCKRQSQLNHIQNIATLHPRKLRHPYQKNKGIFAKEVSFNLSSFLVLTKLFNFVAISQFHISIFMEYCSSPLKFYEILFYMTYVLRLMIRTSKNYNNIT